VADDAGGAAVGSPWAERGTAAPFMSMPTTAASIHSRLARLTTFSVPRV
jgi:hypothetical protein